MRSLSWKQKLLLLIGLSLTSLAVMAASAIWVNQRLAQAYLEQQTATDFRSQTRELLNDWLRLRNLRGQLTAESAKVLGTRITVPSATSPPGMPPAC